MLLVPIILLALMQGLGEFLPIGASGQLVLVPALAGWPDQGLAVDLGAHIGALIAVMLYFWRDVGRMATGLLKLLLGELDEGGRLALQVLFASLPAIGLGALLQYHFGPYVGGLTGVAATTIVFAALLYAADRIGATFRRVEHMTFGLALIIGIAEALAFLPGTGRTSIAMLMARLLGYERPDAARFAFLLSIPAIAAIAGVEVYRLIAIPSALALSAGAPSAGALHDAAEAALFSGIASLIAIAFLMRWLEIAGFGIFALYRLIFGAVLLYLAYGVRF